MDLALKLGAFFGAMLGAALKVCGPQIGDILAGAIRKAFSDSAELGTQSPVLQRLFDDNPPRADSAGNGGGAGTPGGS